MTRSRVLARALLLFWVGLPLIEACSSSEEPGLPDGPAAGRGADAGAGGADVIPGPDKPFGGDGGAGLLNPLCGADLCVPDDPDSCAQYVPSSDRLFLEILRGAGSAGAAEGARGEGSAGEGGAGGSAGGEPIGGGGGADGRGGESGGRAGGVGGGGRTDAGSAGFAGGILGAAGSGGGSGPIAPGEAGSAGAGAQPAAYACRISPSSTGPFAHCAASGRGEPGAPCFSSGDCAAGLACVTDGIVGRCRPFCCGGEGVCDAFPGTFCDERELAGQGVSPAMRAPVCVPAENCDLGEPPCERAGACQCPPETACQVVRPDGMTACLPEGAGTSGESCPCAYGHVCSRADDTCLSLCRTRVEPEEAECFRCQTSAELPDGWGVCID